jgi:hypothetical protein
MIAIFRVVYNGFKVHSDHKPEKLFFFFTFLCFENQRLFFPLCNNLVSRLYLLNIYVCPK